MNLLFSLLTFSLTLANPANAHSDGGISSVFAAEAVKDVEVFVTAWCPYCRKLEHFLQKNGVKYTRYDIEKDTTGRAKYQKIGQKGIPVTKVGEEVIVGFDQFALSKSLKLPER